MAAASLAAFLVSRCSEEVPEMRIQPLVALTRESAEVLERVTLQCLEDDTNFSIMEHLVKKNPGKAPPVGELIEGIEKSDGLLNYKMSGSPTMSPYFAACEGQKLHMLWSFIWWCYRRAPHTSKSAKLMRLKFYMSSCMAEYRESENMGTLALDEMVRQPHPIEIDSEDDDVPIEDDPYPEDDDVPIDIDAEYPEDDEVPMEAEEHMPIQDLEYPEEIADDHDFSAALALLAANTAIPVGQKKVKKGKSGGKKVKKGKSGGAKTKRPSKAGTINTSLCNVQLRLRLERGSYFHQVTKFVEGKLKSIGCVNPKTMGLNLEQCEKVAKIAAGKIDKEAHETELNDLKSKFAHNKTKAAAMHKHKRLSEQFPEGEDSSPDGAGHKGVAESVDSCTAC